MAKPTAPAEGATTATTPAAPAATAEQSKLDAAIAQSGMTPDEFIAAAAGYQYAGTPEGYARLVARVAETNGEQIAKAALAANPDAVLKGVDREVRRKVRRSVGRLDAAGQPVEHDDEPQDDPAAEAREVAAKAAEERERTRDRKVDTAVRAIQLTPALLAMASKDSRIAANFNPWMKGVTSLIETGHPKYQGQGGEERASEDVLNQWAAYGQMAGLERKAPPVPPGGSEVPMPKQEDIAKTVREAREKTRGQTTSSLVDEIMAREFPGAP